MEDGSLSSTFVGFPHWPVKLKDMAYLMYVFTMRLNDSLETRLYGLENLNVTSCNY